MVYFGDVSGNFRGLLRDEVEVCVAAVVGGARQDCYRCAKKTVRNVTDIPEAKWNDLTRVQKRRFFDCLSDNSDSLQFGYAAFRKEHLQSLERYHKLYQDVRFPPAWDLALTGYAYGELLFELSENVGTDPELEFDRVASEPQCEGVVAAVQELVAGATPTYKSSRQVPGIQAADCLAGGVAEQLKGGEPWLDHLSQETVLDCRDITLIQLENKLSEA